MKRTRANLAAFIVCAILGAIYATTARLAWLGKCPTYDEPLHLVSAWGESHEGDFYVDPENPPLWKYIAVAGTKGDDLPIDLSLPRIDDGMFCFKALYRQPGVDPDALISAARLRMIVLALGLGVIAAWWAWRLAGPLAAAVTMAFFCLDPNFLAHGPLVKNDVPIALSFLAFMSAVWLVGERATIWRMMLVGLLLGAALNVKFSGLLAIPMFAIALTSRAIMRESWPILGRTLTMRGHRLAAAAMIFAASTLFAYGTIWATYQFRYAPGGDGITLLNPANYAPSGRAQVMTVAHDAPPSMTPEGLAQPSVQPQRLTKFVDWLSDRHFLPQAWLMGFLYTYGLSFGRPTFFCGEFGMKGWWYYFPMAMAFKTTITTLAALVLATISLRWWHGDREDSSKKRWLILGSIAAAAIVTSLALFHLCHPGLREYLPIYSRAIIGLFVASMGGVAFWAARARLGNPWPLISAIVCPAFYLLVAMRSDVDIGLRHILLLYPFLFIYLGVAAASARRRWPRAGAMLVAVCICGLAWECFGAFPDYIPFFNKAVGGARGGLNLLSDSNIDWGQELPDLVEWQKANPARPLFLSYFGQADPRHYPLICAEFDEQSVETAQQQKSGPRPVFAISAVSLQGTYLHPDQVDQFRPFRHMEPFQVLGGSLYLFDTPQPSTQPP